jgi:hypothetical protein
MTTFKAEVTLQDSMCQQVATLANEMQISQNELLALAIAEYVQKYYTQKHQTQKLQQSWNEAYDDGLDEDEKMMLKGMRRQQRRLLNLEDS